MRLLLLLVGCDAFFQGMEEERARIEAEKAAAEAAAAEAPAQEAPARLVPFGPRPLPAEPTVSDVLTWLAANGISEVDLDGHRARPGAATAVPPEDLARAWWVLERAGAPNATVLYLHEIAQTSAFVGGAAYDPEPRRVFLEATALQRSLLDTRRSRPLVELIGWFGKLETLSPEDALVAYLGVMEPDEVAAFLKRAQIVDDDGGEWDVDARRLQPLPDPVLDAIETRLDAGMLGPRSMVVRAIAKERARRAK